MRKQPKLEKCKSLTCQKELEGRQRGYCSNACKQAVKYAVTKGRQCENCGKRIPNPVPVVGGMKRTCFRKACNK